MVDKKTIPATRQELFDWIYEYPEVVGNLMGMSLLREYPHREWIREMVWGKDPVYTLQAHRGSYKTTCLIVSLALIILLYPNQVVRYFRKTDEDVTEVIRGVHKCLQSDIARYICNMFFNTELDIVAFNTTTISTNLMFNDTATNQVTGHGLSGSITGKHADRIFTDDIVNIKDRYSRAAREDTKRFYSELQFILNPGGRMFNLGTPWHKEDCFSVMSEPHKYDCYTTGLLTPEQIQDKRNDPSIPASVFAANYELKHINDEGAVFTNPKWSDDEELFCGGRMHIDAAYGGKDTTAITIFNEKDGNYYFFGKVFDGSVMNRYSDILALHKRFRCGSVYCETNGDKGFLAKDLRGLGLYANSYTETENKFVKIVTHLVKIWDKLYFHTQTDGEYMRQILEFQEKVEPDDAPDSAACAARILLKPGPRVFVL